jgi:sterol desaturase/sphingolipid hydroxylase (fatty acid hydroxylase superfamily)
MGAAWMADQNQWGILHVLDIPQGLAILLAVIALDFIIYLQHILFHAVPVLWRLHMMHHADLDFDVTTGARFHPIEILLSMCIKISVVVLLGVPPMAVLIFEVLLNGTAMFNHSNVRIPERIDRLLRYLVVTPDMHRVHHSWTRHETNSNFGFNLPVWDRLMGTYRDAPEAGHTEMTIGLVQFREPARLTLPYLLVLPFVGRTGGYPINQ